MYIFYQDNRTRLGLAVAAAAGIFETASSTSSLQLCFIVSDARIDSDDRSRLRRILADMTDKHVLVVMLIIDVNDNPKDSIFNTRLVEFHDGKVKTSSYLDNFPFPLYITVNRLEILPQVLADALRQWFEATAIAQSG